MSVQFIFITIILALFLVTGSSFARTISPEGAQVYMISPADGEVVVSPIIVRFGLKGMGVAPAGIDKPNTGHHHLLIDMASNPALDEPLPSNAKHKHFGGGQTETTVELSPGEHTLQLMLGDKNHIPHSPPVMSEVITITVK
ncbi:MAG: rod shape-determining protein RodA [Nitrosomonadaceae bacterium]|nr:rod shape-determining protein RodA [Nitrosomonadaceae bacterium]|tara:strand:+ start:170 stop:595 length:426 start_codon:yes stop_codon:yes gene_type:complete